jgi:hypothetical protein
MQANTRREAKSRGFKPLALLVATIENVAGSKIAERSNVGLPCPCNVLLTAAAPIVLDCVSTLTTAACFARALTRWRSFSNASFSGQSDE